MFVNEQIRQKAGLVYNVVESVILAMSVGLMLWVCNVVVTHGNVLATQSTKIEVNSARLDRIETRGSDTLQSHIKADDERVIGMDKRIEKLEQAVIALQSAPGELKAIAARLDNLKEGQERIEKAMDKHLANGNGKSNP